MRLIRSWGVRYFLLCVASSTEHRRRFKERPQPQPSFKRLAGTVPSYIPMSTESTLSRGRSDVAASKEAGQ
jgi:hypothetical protein